MWGLIFLPVYCFQLAPGELFPLKLQSIDELGHDVVTVVFGSEVDQVNSTSKVLLDNIVSVLLPNSSVWFSFHTQNNTVKEKRKIQFVDPFSALINGYSFEMELQQCHPGFRFSNKFQRCVCDETLDAVQRYDGLSGGVTLNFRALDG